MRVSGSSTTAKSTTTGDYVQNWRHRAIVIVHKAIRKQLSTYMSSTGVIVCGISAGCLLLQYGTAIRAAFSLRVTGWVSSLSIIFTTAKSLFLALRSKQF